MRSVNFDAVRVGELAADFMSVPNSLTVKAAFVNTDTGATHGWTSGVNWSPETIARLKELRLSIEMDIEKVHFEGVWGNGVSAIVTPPLGLGEHLGSVPQA